MPSVSVVIPCFNYGRFLAACVESVLSQPGVDVEVLVVDDASTDETPSVAGEFAAHDARVVHVRHRVNQGHIETYNDGLRRSQGEYVVLLSADDLLTPGSLQRATALFRAHPDVGFVYGRATAFSDAVPTPSHAHRGRERVWSGREWLERRAASGTNCIYSPEVVMRASAPRRAGGFCPSLPHTADLHLWLAIASFADVGYISGPDQALYRVHASNMHTTRFAAGQVDGMLADLRHRLAAFDWVVDAPPAGVLIGQQLRSTARSALGREALDLVLRAYTWGLSSAWPVEDLLAFAEEVAPRPLHAWRWSAVDRLSRMDPARVTRHPVLVAREEALRVGARLQNSRLQRTGA